MKSDTTKLCNYHSECRKKQRLQCFFYLELQLQTYHSFIKIAHLFQLHCKYSLWEIQLLVRTTRLLPELELAEQLLQECSHSSSYGREKTDIHFQQNRTRKSLSFPSEPHNTVIPTYKEEGFFHLTEEQGTEWHGQTSKDRRKMLCGISILLIRPGRHPQVSQLSHSPRTLNE